MPCSNNIPLVCCSDPTRAILPCNPTVNGTPNSLFIDGGVYTTTDGFYGTLCWEADASYTGTIYSYTLSNNFTSFTSGFGNTCVWCEYVHGAACINIPSTFTGTTLTKCSNPEITINVDVPTNTTLNQTFVVDGQCYFYDNDPFVTAYGVQYVPQYDNCSQCDDDYPNQYTFSGCCQVQDGSLVFSSYTFNLTGTTGPVVGESVYVETSVYSGCAVCIVYNENYPLETEVIGTIYDDCADCETTYPCNVYGFINVFWENCCDGTRRTYTVPTSAWSYGNSINIGGVCYFYTGEISTDTTLGLLDTYEYVDCDECETSVPCTTPTPTSTVTPTPTVTPTVTPSNAFGTGSVFDYDLSITGACVTGLGSALITGSGGVPPYTFDWYSPNLGPGPLKTNLTPGTYLVRANDSSAPVNNEFYVNVQIQECLCVTLLNVYNTTCGENNGSVTATTNSIYSSVDYSLYTVDGDFVQSGTSSTNEFTFFGLSGGTYYITVNDIADGIGQSQSFIVEESDPFDFGLYIVPNASCGTGNIGKLFVTGQTGNPPYSYQWSTGAITSSITGLTAGVYSVQVTDGQGCVKVQTATIENLDPVGFGSFVVTQPTCFANNGIIELNITGGTVPYYYSASTGTIEISYSPTFILSGLSNGTYGFTVTDAALCTFSVSTALQSPNSISSVNVFSQNSQCSDGQGSISVEIIGGIPNYTYSLVYPTGNVDTVTSTQTAEVFSNLSAGTYTVIVGDQGGCVYQEEVDILTVEKFDFYIYTTGSTCNNPFGGVKISVQEGAVGLLTYSIDGIEQITDTSLSSVTFSNISVGQHTVTVTDFDGCAITKPFVITSTEAVNFSLYSTSCGDGNDGVMTAFISSGVPPFTFYWSNNVPSNPQQITVSGLTGGTYSLIVVDSNGWSLARTTTIDCDKVYVSYQSYTMGEDEFTIVSPTKCGIQQILVDGFYDLTSGNTDCILTQAVYTAKVQVQPLGTILTNTFYTGTSLNDVPSDGLWFSTIENMIESISGIIDVQIDPVTNQITIKASPGSSVTNQEIIVELIIVYDIDCLT